MLRVSCVLPFPLFSSYGCGRLDKVGFLCCKNAHWLSMNRTDCSNLSTDINDVGVSLDLEDEPAPIPSSAPEAQNINSDSVVSLAVSGETRVNSGNTSNSPSYCDNKSAYSSMVGCPFCSKFILFCRNYEIMVSVC